MSAAIKTTGQITATVSTAKSSARQQMIPESAGLLIIGTMISTGAPFSRPFPNDAAMTQWLASGAGNDVDVSRVVPWTFVA